jgi:hypothetical protein
MRSLCPPLPANPVLQDKIGYLLKRPVGRPSQEVAATSILDGRGRGAATDVLGYSVADRPAAGTARASMTGRPASEATGGNGRSAP